MSVKSILAIPPFPGARTRNFAVRESAGRACSTEPDELLAALAADRVGGCYWGRHAILPPGPYVLDGTGCGGAGAVAWGDDEDPWHLLGRADFVRVNENDPRALLALAAQVPVMLVSADGGVRDACSHDAKRLIETFLAGWRYQSPFDNCELSALDAIALCGFWRQQIDANRLIHSVMGIAYWKKPTVSALLWAGTKVPYNRPLDGAPAGAAAAIWRSRLKGAQQRELERTQLDIIEIEDGFMRSHGLGADCIPPLSIIVDDLGAHFAPGRPSRLEMLLQTGDFAPDLIERARKLRQSIIAAGLSKYESGAKQKLGRPGGERRHVLVPGQVEGDRAVTSGGALSSNLELLQRARAVAGPDAFLIYKPHPDVLAGHRRGLIPEKDLANLTDAVDTTSPMPSLMDMVDELHVNSSLAGFEALLRGKPVTVHGVPFYAGWGLTTDLGPVPARRTARRSVDELVAAALLLYPRYFDPKSGLPAPAEVVVARLASGSGPDLDLGQLTIVAGRRLQGRLLAGLARLAR